jgi:hypothetical protein
MKPKLIGHMLVGTGRRCQALLALHRSTSLMALAETQPRRATQFVSELRRWARNQTLCGRYLLG